MIYVASRASIPARAEMWRRLRDEFQWPIISSWIDEAGEGETEDFGKLWERIEAEIKISKGLVLYAQIKDFPLKGALHEAGMAVAFGKPVAVVLPFELDRSCRPIGSWVRHPRVKVCRFFYQALRHVGVSVPDNGLVAEQLVTGDLK